MFKKVLIAEDLDAISQSLSLALEKFEIPEIHHSKYCDDALLKIKIAIKNQQPYDLLISDLSFKPDHRTDKLGSGIALIEAVKSIQPEIKIIVYSIEDKSYLIKSLFNISGINAYVLKTRNSIPELQKSIQLVYDSYKKIMSQDLEYVLNNQAVFEIESFDVKILILLSNGNTIEEISTNLKALSLSPNGTSSLEKRIGRLKIYFKANNNVHLVSIAKDLGLI